MKENHVMFKQSVFFDDNGELNDTGILLYVDALRLQRESELPEDLVEHVTNSVNDQKKIFEYYEFVKDDDPQELIPHPYFDKNTKKNTPVVGLNKFQGLGIAAALLLTMGGGYLATKFWKYDNGKTQGNRITVTDSTSSSKKNMAPTPISDKGKVKSINQQPTTDSARPNSNNNSSKETPLPNKNTQPISTQTNLLENEKLLAMQHISYYDKQINRLSNNRSGSIKVIAPAIDAKSQSILFQWTNPIQDSLRLEVFTKETDDSRRKVFMIAPKSSQFTLPAGFKPGLYYWELKQVMNNSREKRIGLGRFIVAK
ncbi:hypothetical protein [Microscilla marina]|uniref:Uncharacterized protein n=1 Tax=Microscilla marina ATCC 23134 TaxID=313606 RepID=A1ZYU4_MICM2|nr:hypothetical protein [Microscilla marina]EAY24441.1 hypothetical protein M23134_06295 [Microscilla marina ATCC 23134]